MPDALPTFLVAGAGRSGTTGLVEGLRTHRDVFVTDPKEPHYFALHGRQVDFQAPGDQATINRVAITDRDRYLALYEGSHGAAARGDGSVSTLYYHRESIPEILDVNPAIRVVIMLRDPVERAHSAFQYMRGRGFEPQEFFLDAIADEERRIAADWHHLWHYTGMSLYADAVRDFLARMSPGQVGVWFYDELQDDYEACVGQVLRFLDVAPAEGEGADVPRVNVSGTPRSRLAHGAIMAATRSEPVRRSVKTLTTYRMREYVRGKVLRPSGVDESARRELAPRFDADLARLAQLLRDHGHPRALPAWLTSAG